MGLKTALITKVKDFAAPVAKFTGKVMSKVDVNKPEIMLITGIGAVVTGTVWMIINARKVDDIIEESEEQVMQLDDFAEGKYTEDEEGNLVRPKIDTKADYNKAMAKIRMHTVWQFVKLFGLPALIYILGILDLIGGHGILKKRYIVATTSLKGMEEFVRFLKQNIIDDVGEEKWNEYAKGIVDKQKVAIETKDSDGTIIRKEREVPICKDHENPWRIEYKEDLFNTWKSNTESNIFFLQTIERYFDEKYQRDKNAEISIYEILEYMGINWSKVDKSYRTWLRNQVWGHHIYGDDKISLGLHMPLNDPARRRQSDKIFIEFNSDGMPDEIINRYTDPVGQKIYQKGKRRKTA